VIDAWMLLLVPISYLLGSIPFGVLVGKMRGIDIQKIGSGNTGAANVMRSLGWQSATLVFIADALKAALPVIAARLIAGGYPGAPWLEVACGLAAIAGHNWSIFLGFKGGKGVSSSFGVLLAIAPLAAAVTLLVFIALVAITRYVSLGSIVGGCIGGLALVVQVISNQGHIGYAILALILASMIVIQHKGNLQRLVNGTERKLGQRAS
jgi:glycerol-3-phosphate acyltransferase PlsY